MLPAKCHVALSCFWPTFHVHNALAKGCATHLSFWVVMSMDEQEHTWLCWCDTPSASPAPLQHSCHQVTAGPKHLLLYDAAAALVPALKLVTKQCTSSYMSISVCAAGQTNSQAALTMWTCWHSAFLWHLNTDSLRDLPLESMQISLTLLMLLVCKMFAGPQKLFNRVILVAVRPEPCLLCSNIRVQRLPSIAIHQSLLSMSGCRGGDM